MNSDRWRQLESLFAAGAELKTDAREQLLRERAPHDPELQAEVRDLWLRQTGGTNFLNAPIARLDGREPIFRTDQIVAGRYRILNFLGAGGMGEVYRAQDVQLGRIIALKAMLSSAAGDDPDRRKQVEREARALSELKHPNICLLYDLCWDGNQPLLIMEFLSGHSLSQRLVNGPLPVSELVSVGIDIGRALAFAHSRGIVHRDVKPGNIMITDDAPKLLDFGLAKRVSVDPTSSSATVTAASAGGSGAAVGTVAYMSPEQAQGAPLGPASDVFSFGAVLYEMATGERAFQRDTPLTTMAAVVSSEPRPMRELAPSIPPSLDRIVRKCLSKQADERFSSMNAAVSALQQVKSGSRAIRNRWFAASGILLAIVLGAAVWLRSPRMQPSTPLRLTRVTQDNVHSSQPALSPDGNFIAYTSDRSGNLDIYVQRIAGGDPIRVTNSDFNEDHPAFSADGTQIVYERDEGEGALWIAPSFGQSKPRLFLAGDHHNPTFSRDGKWLAYWTGHVGNDTGMPGGARIFVAPTQGGESKQLFADVPNVIRPLFSPDSRYVMAIAPFMAGSRRLAQVYVASVDDGTTRRTNFYDELITPTTICAPRSWEQDVLICSFSQLGVVEAPFDQTSMRVTGPVRQVLAGTSFFQNVASNGPYLAIEQGDIPTNGWTLKLDRHSGEAVGVEQIVTHEPLLAKHLDMSPDGSQIGFSRPRSAEVVVQGIDGTVQANISNAEFPTFLNNDALLVRRLSTSPDHPPTGIDTYYIRQQRREPLCRGCKMSSISADGKWIFSDQTNRRGGSILVSRGHTAGIEILRDDKRTLMPYRTSPDGKWIAFVAARLNTSTIYVAPFRESTFIPAKEWVAITDDSTWHDNPTWSEDGRFLYFAASDDKYGCLFAQQLRPATMKPHGKQLAVRHYHKLARDLRPAIRQGGRMAIANGTILLPLTETRTSVWLAQR